MKRKSKILFVHKSSSIEYKLLLGRRTSNNESFWWIPGGSVEQGESDFEAGLRELDEELYLTNDYLDALNAYTIKNEVPNKIEYLSSQAKNIIFIIPIHTTAVIPLPPIKDEFEEVSWHNLNALPTNMSREYSYVENQLHSIIKML